jgi:hypothetical protein
MIGIAIAIVLVAGGAVLLYKARSIVENSMRPEAHWIVPAGWRLPLIRAIGGFYLLIGFLIAYGASHT